MLNFTYYLSISLIQLSNFLLKILHVVNYIHWFSCIKPLLYFWIKLPDQEVFIFFFIHFSVRFTIWLKCFTPMSCLRWPEIFLIHSFWGLLVSNLCYSHIRSWNVLPFYIYFRIIDVDIEIVDWFHRKNFYLRLCSFFLKYIFSVFLSVYCRQTISGFLYLARLFILLPFLSFSSIQFFTVRNFLLVWVLTISFHFLQAFIVNVETSSLTKCCHSPKCNYLHCFLRF